MEASGVEFDSDVFAGIPPQHHNRYLTALLTGDPGQIEHRRNEMRLKPGARCRYTLHLVALEAARNQALEEIYRRRGGYRVDPALYSLSAAQGRGSGIG